MPIVNLLEHAKCQFHEHGEHPLIKIHELAPKQPVRVTMRNDLLVFIMSGNAHYNMGNDRNIEVGKGDFFIYPHGCEIELNVDSDCIMMAFRLLHRVSFCECYMIEQLFEEYRKKVPEDHVDFDPQGSYKSQNAYHNIEPQSLPLLRINAPIWSFLRDLHERISDGLLCRNYFEIKIKELFYLLRSYYPKDQLYHLFYPMASPDTAFSDYVRLNYRKYKTVSQLAASMNLSHSGFARKFLRVFHQPPYQWMIEQKSEEIYAELVYGSKNLKQIAVEFDFLSPTQFNDFCKDKWGRTPGAIRKNPCNK